MKTLIIYDSVFGNTKLIAESIAHSIGEEAIFVHVSNAPQDFSGLGLLVVGSPTRAFRATPAITSYLASIPPHTLNGLCFAAFDTRSDVRKISNMILTLMVKLFGYAAEKIEKQLTAKGGLSAGTEWFFVMDSKGPLLDGEKVRAEQWAKELL
jgi:flavodoxin